MTMYDHIYCTCCQRNTKQERAEASLLLFLAVVILGVFASVGIAVVYGFWALIGGFILTGIAGFVTLLTQLDLAASTWHCTNCGTRYNHAAVSRMGREAAHGE